MGLAITVGTAWWYRNYYHKKKPQQQVRDQGKFHPVATGVPTEMLMPYLTEQTFNAAWGVSSITGKCDYQNDKSDGRLLSIGSYRIPFWAVFDGSGKDARAVDFVHRFLYTYISEELLREQGSLYDHSQSLIIRTLESAFKKMQDKLQEQDGWVSGTTAVVALLWHKTLYIAHVGDSRAYLLSSQVNKPIRRITYDQNWSNEAERRRIANQLKEHPQVKLGRFGLTYNKTATCALSHLFFNFKGKPDFESLTPFLSAKPTINVEPIDPQAPMLILASDGLWQLVGYGHDMQGYSKTNSPMTDEDIAKVAKSIPRATSPQNASETFARRVAKALTDEAERRRARDNTTALIVDLAPFITCRQRVSTSH